MSCVLISISYGDNPVTNYFELLAEQFVKDGFHVVFIFDLQPTKIPDSSKAYTYLTWPSMRPNRLVDFFFLNSVIKKYKPSHCIAIFGSVNVMLLVSYMRGVRNRIAWIRTTNKQILLDSKNQFISKLKALRKRFIYKFATHIYTNSIGTLKDSILTYKIPERKIIVLHNLLKPSKYRYKTLEEREMNLCIVGRLHKSKGHEMFLIQFSKLIQLLPFLKLIIIGNGPEMQNLVHLTKKLGIYDKVKFFGKIENINIGEYFSKSIIGVSSSSSEAFGWVNIEALREGTPIISTPTEGAMDILKSGVNGEFFDINNQESLRLAVEKILSDWTSYSNQSLAIFNNSFNSIENIKTHYLLIKSNSK